MIKYLLPKDGSFYKANLHCHTTLSDGKKTPKEIKEMYMEQGYSVVAFTDHNVFLLHHDELSDDSFLTLNGFEADINEEYDDQKTEHADIKTCHICFIAKDPKNELHPFWHRSKYLFANAKNYRDQVKFNENDPDFERAYTPKCINEMIRLGKERGFFVTYNHPTWSMEGYAEYSKYEGMDAMEIYNNSCYVLGYPEYNPRVYDDLLRQNKRIFCVATDDNHNALGDSFGGFTVIKADKLDYASIINALETGNFYASQGPIIKALWYEDKKICIDCEPAARVQFNTAITLANSVKMKDGEPITHAEFPLDQSYGYVRVTVVGKNGKKANTNTYFLDELMKEDMEAAE